MENFRKVCSMMREYTTCRLRTSEAMSQRLRIEPADATHLSDGNFKPGYSVLSLHATAPVLGWEQRALRLLTAFCQEGCAISRYLKIDQRSYRPSLSFRPEGRNL